mmetsp:Transcript_78282/g.155121  ORF Transcript_78282/g.155121 Transcript_78282/m.155121 type:complete len:118 (+) Transcript_78282:45-398(+)
MAATLIQLVKSPLAEGLTSGLGRRAGLQFILEESGMWHPTGVSTDLLQAPAVRHKQLEQEHGRLLWGAPSQPTPPFTFRGRGAGQDPLGWALLVLGARAFAWAVLLGCSRLYVGSAE